MKIPLEEANRILCLSDLAKEPDSVSWVTKNTAMLVIHGFGNQLPLETLDMFGRGLIKQLQKSLGKGFYIEHHIMAKEGSNGLWFDNVIRLRKTDSPYFIDLYEYYWANYTEDKATLGDLNKWLNGVISGARSFYENKGQNIGEVYKEKSIFFDKKGKFRIGRYKLFLGVLSKIVFWIALIWSFILKVFARIPWVGELGSRLLKNFMNSWLQNLVNVVGDIAIYNVVDPKSKFFEIRTQILNGAVEAVKYIIEKEEKDVLTYPSVIIAGHSLGSQVGYDAINKLNFLVNNNLLKNYDCTGICLKQGSNNPLKISEQLTGFITFGCPLDKIVFFLREYVPTKNYLRAQILIAYHGFKQREWDFNSSNEKVPLNINLKRFLEDVNWRNYFDDRDYVSGSLDYFQNLTNINCQLEKKWFTHGDYWECEDFYKDIIRNYFK